jgi:hypothetical protein
VSTGRGCRRRAIQDGAGLAVLAAGVLYGSSMRKLASAEGDDASDGIVGRNPNGHSITRHHLDAETAHTAAQLRKHLVALVALHTVKSAAVDRNDCALHINQIILAQ